MTSINDNPPDANPGDDPDEAIQDYVSERSVIGFMLAKPDHWHLVTEHVRPEDFYVPVHRKAYTLLLTDGTQTPEELADQVGNIEAVVFTGWKNDAYLDIDTREATRRATRVARLAMRRRVIAAANTMIADSSNPNLGEDSVVERAKERLEQIVAPNAPPDNPAKPIDVFLAGIDYSYDWVIPNLLERRDRMIVTGTPGTGKSTLLRQIAMCSAAGIHPFTGYPMPPMKVLLLDLENSDKQVGRKTERPLAALGPFDSNNLHVVALPQVIDVTTDGGWRWLAGQAELVKPDLIVGGPVYRMYQAGDASRDMGGRDKAVQVARALDRLRFKYNCALAMEAHPPKDAINSLSPWGSMIWEAWPEFGVGLKPVNPPEPSPAYLVHWRYPRDDRDWPKQLERGGAYGFRVIA